jgi:CMP-N,N'-diacetyllegionaminic acid synthase
MQVLGIIPARKGSKGVPGKNMVRIAGKPLIGYTIDTALQTNALADVLITTDDEAIWDYAAKFNVYVHKRDAQLATDTSPVVLTIIEVLHYAEKLLNKQYDAIMLLQPTAPLREPWHIEEAIALLKNNTDGYECVISVVKAGDLHPARMYSIDATGRMLSLQPENEQLNRQQLPSVYLRNGSIYLTTRNALLTQQKMIISPALAYIMDAKYHLNIDEPRDMLLAKAILENNDTV